MAALISFVGTYAIWIYLLCALGVLIGIKFLTDARRLARTTLFSLDQERAGEQTFRSILLILFFMATMAVVAFLNSVVGPAAPISESLILRGTTPTLSAFVFPSNTPVPSSTPTLVKPTETPFLTSTPTVATSTRLPTVRPIVTAPPVLSQLPSATATSRAPAPVLTGPPNNMVTTGRPRANADLTFKWECEQCLSTPNDVYVLVISFVDKRTGFPNSKGGRTTEKFYVMGSILVEDDFYQQAKDDAYQWYVEVRRGSETLSKSVVWKFIWH